MRLRDLPRSPEYVVGLASLQQLCLHHHSRSTCCCAPGTPLGTFHHQNHLSSRASHRHFMRETQSSKVKEHAGGG